MECIVLNWLYQHTKKVRKSQASISRNSCIESSKTRFSLWVSLRHKRIVLIYDTIDYCIDEYELL